MPFPASASARSVLVAAVEGDETDRVHAGEALVRELGAGDVPQPLDPRRDDDGQAAAVGRTVKDALHDLAHRLLVVTAGAAPGVIEDLAVHHEGDVAAVHDDLVAIPLADRVLVGEPMPASQARRSVCVPC